MINIFLASALPFFAAPPPASTERPDCPETSGLPVKHMTNIDTNPASACTILTGMSRISKSGFPPVFSVPGLQ